MKTQFIVSVASFALAGTFAAYYFLRNRRSEILPGKDKKFTKKQLQHLEELRKKYPPVQSDERLASFKKAGYVLEDITQNISVLLDTHSIPPEEKKTALKSGDLVRLKFIDSDNKTMKLWVEVIAFHKGLYQSELKTDAYSNENLKYGSNVWFHSNHILEIAN